MIQNYSGRLNLRVLLFSSSVLALVVGRRLLDVGNPLGLPAPLLDLLIFGAIPLLLGPLLFPGAAFDPAWRGMPGQRLRFTLSGILGGLLIATVLLLPPWLGRTLSGPTLQPMPGSWSSRPLAVLAADLSTQFFFISFMILQARRLNVSSWFLAAASALLFCAFQYLGVAPTPVVHVLGRGGGQLALGLTAAATDSFVGPYLIYALPTLLLSGSLPGLGP